MTLDFGATGHETGDKSCDACHLSHVGFPELHECGGYLHADTVEDEDGAELQDEHGNPTLALQCDGCGAKGTRVVARKVLGRG